MILSKKISILNLTLFFFISSYFLLIIKDNLISENSFNSTLILYCYLYLIVILQILFLYTIKNTKLFNLTVFIFLFYNFYSLNLSINSEFTILEGKEKLINISFVLIIYSIIFIAVFRKEKIIKTLIILYLLFNIYELISGPKIISGLLNSNDKNKVEFVTKKFLKKPNIYIWSIESLSSDKIAKYHFGIDKTLYMDTFREENFTVMKNHFSDDYSTRNSLNSLLAIDQSLWKKNKKDYFSGRDNAPLFELLRANNYKIITGYHDSHFGPSGKYVDEYLTFRSIKVKNKSYKKYYVNYCQFKMPWYHLQMFNYCEFLKYIFDIKKSEKLNSKKDFEKYILNYIGKNNEYSKFVIFHQLTHSHPNPDTKNWIKIFNNQKENNIKLIKSLTKKIKENDKDSILIVIGDHGPSLLKMSTEKIFHDNIYATYDGDKTMAYLMDRFYTVGTIFDNSSLCTEEITELKLKRYTTNSMLLNGILKCILDNKQLTKNKLIYKIPGYKDTPIKDSTKYEDFLYKINF